jgi:hypothetical protein
LQAPRFGALHILPDPLDLRSIHAVVGQSTLFEKLLTVFAVGQVVDDLMEASLDLGPVTVPDRLDEEVAKPLFAEQLTQDTGERVCTAALQRIYRPGARRILHFPRTGLRGPARQIQLYG